MAQNEEINKMINSKEGLSVYGYIRQNFVRKFLIQEIITTIIQFYMNKGGFLYVCGSGHHGRLGIKEFFGKECKIPTHVETVKDIVHIAAYEEHTLLVDYEGRVWAFGCGLEGRLGTGNNEHAKVPKQIFLKQRAIAVSVGFAHSMILIDNGNVLSCGRNFWAQLGHGNTQSQSVPKIIAALKGYKIMQISAGSSHNGALSKNGDLFMWGCHYYGQCGVGQGKGDTITTPKLVKLNEKVSAIECGSHHSLLITMGNLLYSFGYNSTGQLGHGTANKQYVPTLIDALKDVTIVNVAGGGCHTLCVDEKFNVWAFGKNEDGQCGHSEKVYRQDTPKKIKYFAVNKIRAMEVSAGILNSCVITQNNECFVFGSNEHCQTGLKERRNYFIPTKLALSVQKASMGSYVSSFISDYKKE